MGVTIPSLRALQVCDDPRVGGDLGVEAAHHLLTTAKDCCTLEIPQLEGCDDKLCNLLLSEPLSCL